MDLFGQLKNITNLIQLNQSWIYFVSWEIKEIEANPEVQRQPYQYTKGYLKDWDVYSEDSERQGTIELKIKG